MGIRSRLWRSEPDSLPPTLRHDLATTLYEYGLSWAYGISLATLIDIADFGAIAPFPSLHSPSDPGGFLALRASIVTSRLLPSSTVSFTFCFYGPCDLID